MLRKSLRALCFALAFSVILVTLQITSTPTDSVMGIDTASLAGTLAQKYPGIVMAGLAKAIFLHLLIVGIGIGVIQIAPQKFRKSSIVLYIFGYGAVVYASVIHMPALYENVLPNWGARTLIQSAHFLNPNIISFLGFIMMMAPAAPRLWSLARNTNRKLLFAKSIAIILLAGVLSWQGGAKLSNHKQPNILMLSVDSLRVDRTTNPEVVPNISKLLEDSNSIFFSDHIVGVPRTYPSWAEILTGKYAPTNGIRHMFPSLTKIRSRYPSFVTQLADAGYSTAVISDFAGDIFPKLQAGFEKVESPRMDLETITAMGVSMSFPIMLPLVTETPLRKLFPELRENPTFADPMQLTSSANKFILNSEKPFLLNVFFSTAHFPYASPWPYYLKYAPSDYEGQFLFQKNPDLHGDRSQMSEADIAQVRALYDGAINSIDHAIEKIFENLKRENLWENTIIIVTADHGEDLYEGNNLQGHGEHLYSDNVLQVPFILKTIEKPAVRTSGFISRSVDIAPTILDLVGVKSSENSFDGISLASWIKGGQRDKIPWYAYSETGLWYTPTGEGNYQDDRITYPSISELLHFSPGGTKEVTLKKKYEQITTVAKHRAISTSEYRLIYKPSHDGVKLELFNRKDMSPADPTSETAKHLKKELYDFLSKHEINSKIANGYILPR